MKQRGIRRASSVRKAELVELSRGKRKRFAVIRRTHVHPEADKIVLVQDNLNTHKVASLHAAFSPTEARRPIDKLEIHDTRKHGSWLTTADARIKLKRLYLVIEPINLKLADH